MNGAEMANSVYMLAMSWMVWGLILGRGKRFSFLQNPSAQLKDPPSFLLRDYFGSFLGRNWLGHELDHALASGGDVQNHWSFVSTGHACLHGMDKDNSCYLTL
jgi:hypothetical protein